MGRSRPSEEWYTLSFSPVSRAGKCGIKKNVLPRPWKIVADRVWHSSLRSSLAGRWKSVILRGCREEFRYRRVFLRNYRPWRRCRRLWIVRVTDRAGKDSVQKLDLNTVSSLIKQNFWKQVWKNPKSRNSMDADLCYWCFCAEKHIKGRPVAGNLLIKVFLQRRVHKKKGICAENRRRCRSRASNGTAQAATTQARKYIPSQQRLFTGGEVPQ